MKNNIMKNYTFKVIYLNGNEETFYTSCFTNAIYLACAYAVNHAWDPRIKYVSDEKGDTIMDIEPPKFKFSK